MHLCYRQRHATSGSHYEDASATREGSMLSIPFQGPGRRMTAFHAVRTPGMQTLLETEKELRNLFRRCRDVGRVSYTCHFL